MNLKERLLNKIEISNTGCLLWIGQVSDRGYPLIKIKGKKKRVHRIMHELMIGPIPEGYEVDHLCRTRNCVNHKHIEAVTPEINRDRGRSFNPNGLNTGVHKICNLYCPYGHPLFGSNLRIKSQNRKYLHRICRKCEFKSNTKYYDIRNENKRRRRAEKKWLTEMNWELVPY